MKRFVLTILIAVQLTACSGPAVVAYTRGLEIERQANNLLERETVVTNKARAIYFKAIEQYNAAIKLAPEHALAYYHRGLCRGRVGQYEEAITDFSEAVALDPSDVESWRLRAMAYKELQQFDKAIEDYNTAEKLKPPKDVDDAALLEDRAYCKQYSGDHKGALSDALTALRLNPTASNYCAVAAIERSLGHLDKMDEAYERAIQLSPHRISTFQTRGFSNFIVGRYNAALGDFRTALRASEWRGPGTPYAAIYAFLSAEYSQQRSDALAVLADTMERLKLSAEVDSGAHNARVEDTWPRPVLQYFHGDITKAKLLRAAQDDQSRMTEANCYLGLLAILENKPEVARTHFSWAANNGRKDYVETEIATKFLNKLNQQQKQ